jgi:hypothetical protein
MSYAGRPVVAHIDLVDEPRDTPHIRMVSKFQGITYDEVDAAFIAAQVKHSLDGEDGTPHNPSMPAWRKLSILVEEVGEVARALNDGESRDALAKELMQTATMALAWYESIVRWSPEASVKL